MLFRLRVIMVYPSLITCYNALQKQTPVQLHELQIFTWCLTSTILHFWSSIRGTHRAQNFVINKCLHEIVLTEPVLMPVMSAISCTLTWRFWSISIFKSTTVFFTDSFRRTSRLGLIFRASSASTKLSCPPLDCGIWWRIFTMNNSYICRGWTFYSVKYFL